MHKAELLDELRSRIGVASDRCTGNIEELYGFVCDSLYEEMPCYQSVSIYQLSKTHFIRQVHAGNETLPANIPFGEGLFSIAAVRGSMVHEYIRQQSQVFVPFYFGHHLIGQLVVVSKLQQMIDEEEVSLFCELASLFETKVNEFGAPHG
ncbi:hypothetical protein SAMN05444392_102126 [Seinonella peptonophila]|uniref:GAF domain-containing protein n=1 Tax=Seinonella peptonophila TaxID=112248 RepID=A0A1M4V1K3_9BACL|nr:GAF domain-containing protein [Seinonella peptonophila]SHE62871.1 hypothetical protein SAMN05444392_102126 [Seinonella peptonophila]